MTRQAALDELEKPSYDPVSIHHDFEFIASKLGMTIDELQLCFDGSNQTYSDYANQDKLYQVGAKIMKILGKELGGKR